jgi:hypothetical protein
MRSQGLRPRTPNTRSLKGRSAGGEARKAAAPHGEDQRGAEDNPTTAVFPRPPQVPSPPFPAPILPLQADKSRKGPRTTTPRARAGSPTETRPSLFCGGGIGGGGEEGGGNGGGRRTGGGGGSPPAPACSTVRRSRLPCFPSSRAAPERSALGVRGRSPCGCIASFSFFFLTFAFRTTRPRLHGPCVLPAARVTAGLPLTLLCNNPTYGYDGRGQAPCLPPHVFPGP